MIHQSEPHKGNKQLQQLVAERKNLANRLSVLKADFQAEKNKGDKLRDEVSHADSKSGGLFKQSRENDDLQARLRTMENRLDKAFVRYNESLGRLSELRAQIDELRKDRMNFREVVRRAQATCEEKERKIGALISESNSAYSERDRRKMELVHLRASEKSNLQAYETRLGLLNEEIENQTMAQNRPVGQPAADQVSDSGTGAQSEQQEELTQPALQYEAARDTTLQHCAITTVDELFAQAEALECPNFSLYSYVVEHAAQRTKLQEERDVLDFQRRELQKQLQGTEGQQSTALLKLTTDIEKVDEELTAIQQQKTDGEVKFAAIYSSVGEIFDLLACKWDESPEGKSTMTSANSMFCLSSIENVTTSMINFVYERAKLADSLRGDTRPPGAQDETGEPAATISTEHSVASLPAREGAIRVADTTKPLSIDEIRNLLD
jgi:predicted  nucleic acid-binding Zn-ribbon protein